MANPSGSIILLSFPLFCLPTKKWETQEHLLRPWLIEIFQLGTGRQGPPFEPSMFFLSRLVRAEIFRLLADPLCGLNGLEERFNVLAELGVVVLHCSDGVALSLDELRG